MKRFLAIVFLAVILFGAWYLFFKTDKKTKSSKSEDSVQMPVTKHSAEFNKSVDDMVNAYLNMKNAFVNWDTTSVKQDVTLFVASADSLKIDELQKSDSLIFLTVQQNINDIKANAQPISQENDITEMRHDFSMISENLYPLLKSVGYEGTKLYWQNCPMAFGDDKPANWLSNTRDIQNPYLGNKHPEYKSAMVSCGENMDSIYTK
jgi:hypothetical protein